MATPIFKEGRKVQFYSVERDKKSRTFRNIFNDYHGDLSTSVAIDLLHSTTVMMGCKLLNQFLSLDNTNNETRNILSHLSVPACSVDL